ncbi:ABC transporter ATP-binding protein [Treponema primitia]|uniref:ABC transporter ATP-binding protein n=1 Tax=Treponema primitia TaxID=88058 RepID=UPI00030A7937|nr:dipeptide/oligopeptide/nickel ABC transporter ATP-binding protein [Treponema primitia]
MADTKGERIYELSHVSFAYKKKDILKDISLNIVKGENLGIVGESGSGKTTLLALLLRLYKARIGNIAFYGRPLNDMTKGEVKNFRSKVQPVFQDPYLSLDPTQKIESIIGEPLDSLKLAAGREEKRAKIIAALQSVGLEGDILDRFPGEFSGGQRQRISIARALVTNPEVLIADEPVSALDMITKIEILTLLHTLKQNRNFTLIMVSHDLPVVADISARIIVLDRGEIIEDELTRELITAPKHSRTKELIESSIPI